MAGVGAISINQEAHLQQLREVNKRHHYRTTWQIVNEICGRAENPVIKTLKLDGSRLERRNSLRMGKIFRQAVE